jgi:hypothetical protein
MTHRVSSLLVVLVVATSLIGLWTQSAAASPCGSNQIVCPPDEPTTGGDQENGSVVTTGVQFPGVSADSALGQATAANATCADCEWTIAPACIQNGPTDDALCLGALESCADPSAVRYRVYMRVPPGPWQLIDTVCLGPGERPASVADVGERVREVVVNYLPDASPSFQPAQGGVVNLPTIFAAGEPAEIRTEAFDVLGFEVVVTATARWEWTFDDQVTKAFDEPGGLYPDDAVSWTYDASGSRDVSVTTFWKPSFTVNGDGPFAVPGPEISKTAGPLAVPVREARSVLVGG